ncbi:tRNA (adenosine(37)-N6)-threonylcarbamoyltransferase complex dimerization subunit type 1 TsaB [Pararhizobium sp. BT-229]|uniref:tRNA (adenosine(37)-N6)-threonylcarbamoyltransferase complex dimerization subunit type 1 TsaB n=1 Tax=Pararhizobium sp. BT-229 TaxID=2986923 RepID=UPI0021F7A454|nr:tRNA (adenosine(37)-N6)-threonylcarbamoyltransferase complex dimerization subunit type 1 TsaB [Pararhizobium sp. BT-229]MCV9962434.1 tRNA (adenosine(37)-N6)-threonylcarbamoyltransferase complex dimerization subunit type 1 TsaB [Pararhizobium sp. BT-229]
MIVLAIDTAGTGCFAAVYDSAAETVLASAGADIGRGHAEQLMAFIDQALTESGKALADVSRVAVTIGPGSFTGIRVGVAAARGFALALSVPSVGVSTLASLAGSASKKHPGLPVLVAMDAKRDELYCQIFEADGSPRTEAQIVELDEAKRIFADFHGIICGSATRHLTDTPLRDVAEVDAVDIGTVARLGAAADPAQGKPSPLYLRGPDVKSQAGFAVSRA